MALVVRLPAVVTHNIQDQREGHRLAGLCMHHSCGLRPQLGLEPGHHGALMPIVLVYAAKAHRLDLEHVQIQLHRTEVRIALDLPMILLRAQEVIV